MRVFQERGERGFVKKARGEEATMWTTKVVSLIEPYVS
jgi:hypothetical protein